MWAWLGRIKSTWSWGRFAWQLAGALGLTGILGSVGGAVLAVIQGVPLPIALMVGYCTLVGAVYLAMAPLAYRALAQSPANRSSPPSEKVEPDYKVWSHVKILRLEQAAFLWCDCDPNSKIRTTDVEMWLTVFKDAIKARELDVTFSDLDDSVDIRFAVLAPSDDTKVSRENLKQFAQSKNYDPRFLRDA